MEDTARAQQLRYVANRLGMHFESEDSFGLQDLLRDFHLFRQGRYRTVKYVLYKTEDFGDIDVRLFDYEYRKGKSRNRSLKRQTVFFVRSKTLSLPQLLMKPETLFSKLGHYLGRQDIDFEEYPKFSNQYVLKGEDEELVRGVMNDGILKFFSIEKGWSLEGLGFFLILYKRNKVLGPRQIVNFYHQGLHIYEMLKKDWNLKL